MTTAGVVGPAPAVQAAADQEWRATCSRVSVIAGAIGLAVFVLVVVANQTLWMDSLPGLATQFQIEGSGLMLAAGALAAVVGIVTGFLGRKSRRRPAAVAGSWLSAVAFVGFAGAGFALPYFTYVRGLAWAPDSTRIAYYLNEAGIWVVAADGSSEPSQLSGTDRLPVWGSVVVWSPDGTTIGYVQDGQDELGHWWTGIWVVSADGSTEPTQLVANGSSPDWSPDGSTIAYSAMVAHEDPRGELWLMDADGANPRRLMTLPSTQVADMGRPVWSPDGTRIMFGGAAFGEESWGIWVVDADGRNLRQVTTEGVVPEWSPDGRQIAYVVPPSEGPWGTYWVIDVDGTDRTQLPGENRGDPQWTADGRILVDCAEGLCLMDPDGTDRQVLVAAGEGEPLAIESARVLSPDGTRVTYATGAGKRTDIVVHTIEGSTQIALIH